MDYYMNESLTTDAERLRRFADVLEQEGNTAMADAVRQAACSSDRQAVRVPKTEPPEETANTAPTQPDC